MINIFTGRVHGQLDRQTDQKYLTVNLEINIPENMNYLSRRSGSLRSMIGTTHVKLIERLSRKRKLNTGGDFNAR